MSKMLPATTKLFYDSSQRHEMISYLIANGVAIEDCPRNEQDLRNLVHCFVISSRKKEPLSHVSRPTAVLLGFCRRGLAAFRKALQQIVGYP
jgi:hypothetical protein